MPGGFSRLAALAARAADGKNGEDIVLLDARDAGVTDYLLLVTVGSPAQLQAVEGAVEELLESCGVRVLHRDGDSRGLWRVIDYGGLMVHLLRADARDFYDLDRLYHDMPRRRWREPQRAAARARA